MNKGKILIVEDDADFVRGLMMRLRGSGYDVVFATDGYTAIVKARQENPDLIILDLGLPAGDGFGVMSRLKGLVSHLAYTPIIVLSARDPAANEQRALDAGARAFLQKPCDSEVLLRTIEQALAV